MSGGVRRLAAQVVAATIAARDLRAIAVVALIALALGALSAPIHARGSDALAGYREFVRTHAATELLAEARAAMLEHFDPADEAPAGPSNRDADPDWPGAPAALYVSLVDGRATRACVGSAMPMRGSIREAVRALAVQALNSDRRRPPVRREELDRLRIVLSFAGPATTIADPMSVAPARQGLLVSGARGNVAFLPGEARTVSWALREARRTGIVGDPREATYSRFDVVTLSEPVPPRATRADADSP